LEAQREFLQSNIDNVTQQTFKSQNRQKPAHLEPLNYKVGTPDNYSTRGGAGEAADKPNKDFDSKSNNNNNRINSPDLYASNS
jgi:hypothetical protein